MFIDHPITGVGINNFKKLCENEKIYKRLMVNYDCASHPHNTYLQWLAEGGIITFSLFILYLILLSNFLKKNDGNKNNKVIALVLILILFWPIMSAEVL